MKEIRQRIKEKIVTKNKIERRNHNFSILNIVISSNNSHKIYEYREIFKPFSNIKVFSLHDLNIIVNPEETGLTFKENSLIKAQAVSQFTNAIILADDSGLEIEALGGFPGIKSSRFMDNCPYEKKFLAIFDLLKNKENRNAQFHCVITILNLESQPLFFEGIINGKIAKTFTGKKGFGYDPIFVPNGYTKSFAELSEVEKNAISHRGIATQKMINYLKINGYI